MLFRSDKAAPVIAALRREGVIVINAGATVVRFLPPLVIDAEQIDLAVAAFGRALEA